MFNWLWNIIYNEDKSIWKMAHLFENIEKAYECLKLLQENNVIAGSAVIYGCSDSIQKEEVGDIDVFILNKGEIQKVIEIISKYFIIRKYQILKDSYSKNKNEDEEGKEKEKSSVLTLVLKERINFQLILTDSSTAEEIINNFDFDYVSAAIYKNRLFVQETTLEAWKQKKILRANTSDFRPHRINKALNKGFQIPLFTSLNHKSFDLEDIETCEIQNLQLIPFKRNQNTCTLNFEKLKIIDVIPLDEFRMNRNRLIQKAQFLLSDGTNIIQCEKLVADISNNEDIFIPGNNAHRIKDNKFYWVKPIIVRTSPVSKIEYLVDKIEETIHYFLIFKNLVF